MSYKSEKFTHCFSYCVYHLKFHECVFRMAGSSIHILCFFAVHEVLGLKVSDYQTIFYKLHQQFMCMKI